MAEHGRDQVARRIYWGMKEQGMTMDFHCSYDELPHDYRAQLQAVADGIPMEDPYEKLWDFAARSKEIGHYTVEPLLNSYLAVNGVDRGGR